jgi:DNA-binding Lrp family transcriptional regulator
MRLTGNDKKTLKFLLNNSRITDSEIASKLKISNVAVGKIRKKLELSVIKAYTVEVNYAMLGIQTFAIGIAKLTNEGLDIGELEIEQKLLKIPNIMNVYRIPRGNSTHVILYGFRDMNELDDFFHSPKLKQELHREIETHELFIFSHNSLIKQSPIQLIQKAIDDFNEIGKEIKFSEFENFKRRLE